MPEPFTYQQVKQKLEAYCAYQERCHDEVIEKMRGLAVSREDSDLIIVHLIEHNFLNEERFAQSFARGKHRIKHWGKTRIINELKLRNISQYNINTALKEITSEEYEQTFDTISDKHWHSITEKNIQKKRKKFCDFLLRKGFESNLVYQKMKELEHESNR
jgi:regulatory protein